MGWMHTRNTRVDAVCMYVGYRVRVVEMETAVLHQNRYRTRTDDARPEYYRYLCLHLLVRINLAVIIPQPVRQV
jgi:hypothetical protein